MKQKTRCFVQWPQVQAGAALLLGTMFLAQPQAAAQSCADALRLCGGVLLPALFPLFVVCAMLGPLAPILGWPLRPLMRWCGIRSKQAPALLVVGWCGGYAVCTQQIAALRGQNEITRRDAALLLLLGCCSGPGFVVGCIGGQLFGSVPLGVLLYGLQLAANFAAAACLLPFLPRQTETAVQKNGEIKGTALPQAIEAAVQSSLIICGCVVFCRMVYGVMAQAVGESRRPYLSAALEISAGCRDFAQLGSVAGVCLCLSILGISVFAQMAALLQGAVPLRLVLAARGLHCIFLQGMLRLCFLVFPGQVQVYSSLAPRVVVMQRTPTDAAIAVIFFLCAALYQLYKGRQNSYNNSIPARFAGRDQKM